MRDLDHALSLIEAVVGAVSVPVSVKMRLGWDATCLNAPDLARRAQEAGVALVTVHGRTRQQFYKGQADWAAIAAVKQAVTIPVVANGDIGSLADAQTCLKASQADAVMIGREALGRPWLIGAIARGLEGDVWQEPSPETKAQAAIEHYETLLVLFGMEAGVRHARKHLAAYADHAGGLDPVRRARLVTSQKPEEVMALLRASFLNKAQTLECAA